MHKLVHQRILAVAHLVGRALGGHGARPQDHHVVGQREGHLQVVRHQNAGQPHGVVELADELRRRAQRDRIEPGKGLVVHHQLGIERNGTRQRHAPGHATGNLAGHQVTRAAQAHRMQLHEHDVAHQRLGQVGVFAQRKGHVLIDAHVGEQGAKLEQHAHAAPRCIKLGLVHAAHVLPVEQHLALLRLLLAANQAQHRRLAARPRPP
jgi:hypothetical protein